MTMRNDKRIPESRMREWIAEYQCEPALHTLFPLTLSNGKSLPGVHVVCSNCNNRVSGDRVRGRVVQSLKHVLTVSANGYCAECDRMTHIDCRFRAEPDETVIEWLASNGCWQSKEMRKPTLGEKIGRWLRRMASGSAPSM